MTDQVHGGDQPASGPDKGADEIHPLLDLYRRFERRMYRQCLAQLRNPADAEDAVQETFARAARHLDKLDRDPAPYLATVARNVCRDEQQRRARCMLAEDPTMFGELEVGHAETSSIDRDLLNMAWKRFSARERELIGRRFAGFSYEEIAAHLKMTPGALNVAMARARKRARDSVAMTLQGVLLVLGLRRLAGRLAGRSTSTGSTTVSAPAALLAAAAVTCVVVGVGGNWLVPQPSPQLTPSTSAAQHGGIGHARPAGSDAVSVVDAAAGGSGVTTEGRAPAAGPSLHDLATSIVSPGQNAVQEDAVFTTVTPSPAYQRDHTVFASGSLVNGCGRPVCPVIFRTQDGGRTWQHIASLGFLGGQLLLAAAYPADPVIFAAGPAGLQRSDDGGSTFTTVVPGAAPAAVDPRSTAGHARVLIATSAPMIYDATANALAPGPLLPVGITGIHDVAFGTNGDLVFAAVGPDALAAGLQDGMVVRCPGGVACARTLTIAGDPVVNLRLAPTAGAGGAVFAWTTHSIHVSRDGGSTFEPIVVGHDDALSTLVLAPDFASSGTITLSTLPTARASDLLVSSNSGASFAVVPQSGPLAHGVASLVILPDGHELAALATLDGPTGFGIRCSTDRGSQWGMTC
jgi:RNA polymerase sigma-70 factor (ECF subfamily)